MREVKKLYEVRKTYKGFAVINLETGLAHSVYPTLSVASNTCRDLNWFYMQQERTQRSKTQTAVKLVVGNK